MSAEWVRRDFRGRHAAWPAATIPMSVTEEIERVRQAENDRESEELSKVLSISLHEVSHESVNNDDGMGVTNQVLTDR